MSPERVTAPASPLYSRTDRVRTSYRHVIGLLLLALSGCSPLAAPSESSGSTHLFVWAWDVDKAADDFLAVVDVDRHSAAYGRVVRTLPAPGGRGAHHVEYEMTTSQLFANSFDTGHTFVFDLSDAMRPRLFSDFGDAGPYSHPHSFARTPSGYLCSPPIKVSPPITMQLAGWLNWTTVDECSEPRAQPILSIRICAHTV